MDINQLDLARLAVGAIWALAIISCLAILTWLWYKRGGTFKKYFLALPGYRRAAMAIAIITALAEIVIVYDLYQSGLWLAPSALSGAKTAAFVILFIGSLIAEMQDLRRPIRLLLFVAVVALGLYQIQVNILVNFDHANLPESVTTFFAYRFSPTTPADARWWAAVVDGVVRTFVVIIMWLVTGLVWRGEARPASQRGETEVPGSTSDEPAPALSEHQLGQIWEMVAVYKAKPTATLPDVVQEANTINSVSTARRVRTLAVEHGYLTRGSGGRSYHTNGQSPTYMN
ncbi:MAG: hypothetical protein ACE5H9_13885 [Anaerolineae bacterium]